MTVHECVMAAGGVSARRPRHVSWCRAVGSVLTEQMRGSHRVGHMVEHYADLSKSTEEMKALTTPPGGHSPDTTDTEDAK